MFKMYSEPKFDHDCDICLFLGNYHEFDVYFHPAERGGSIILRSGNEPSDYYSSPVSCALYIEHGLTETSDIINKVAMYLLVEGIIKVSLNEKIMEEKREIWDDYWKMRKQ